MGNWYYSFAGLWEKLMNVYFANRSENTANCTTDNSSLVNIDYRKSNVILITISVKYFHNKYNKCKNT